MPITVEMTLHEKTVDLMKDLQVRTGSESVAELIRKAISVYAVLVEAYENRDQVEIHQKSGKVYLLNAIPINPGEE